MNEVFSLMRKDFLSFAKGKTLQQFCILPSAFCIRAQLDKLKFETLQRQYMDDGDISEKMSPHYEFYSPNTTL